MENLTPNERDAISKNIQDRLEKSFEVSKFNRTKTPFYKAILFLFDQYNRKNFYGEIGLKLAGPDVKEVFITKRTFKVDTMYNEEGNSVFKLAVRKDEN